MEDSLHTPCFQLGTCFFQPVTTTPCSTVTITPCGTTQTPPRPVHRCLSISSDNNQASDITPVCSDSSNEEKDFQTVLLDDKHWIYEETPERTFCIHEHGLCITYAYTHALMGAITLFHTWIVWT